MKYLIFSLILSGLSSFVFPEATLEQSKKIVNNITWFGQSGF